VVRNKVISVVFLIVVMIVPLSTLISRVISKEDTESGNTAGFSPISVVAEFLDDVPFREKIARFNTDFTRRLTGSAYINSTQVTLGKNEWLYLKETQEDYERSNCFSEAEKRIILDKLLQWRDIFVKSGMEFVLYIAPNKSTIYYENMPDTVFRRDSLSRAEDLIEYIRANSDIQVIYPEKELMAAKELAPIYYVTDTHWNEVGGYVGAQVLLKELFGFEDKLLKESIQVREEYRRGDLAIISSLQEIFKEYTLYGVDYESLDTSLHTDKRIYCIGDSFWEAMDYYLPYYVEDVEFVHYNDYKALGMYEYDPDVIVFEIVERSLEVFLHLDLMGNAINGADNIFYDKDGNAYYLPNTSFKMAEDGVRYMADGEYVTNSFIEVDGCLYYFDENGYMLTNSFKTEGGYTYYFGNLGVAKSGWVFDGGFYYYFDESLHMVKGDWIVTPSSAWYYMTEDGTMLTDAYTPDGYYVNENGQWIQ